VAVPLEKLWHKHENIMNLQIPKQTIHTSAWESVGAVYAKVLSCVFLYE